MLVFFERTFWRIAPRGTLPVLVVYCLFGAVCLRALGAVKAMHLGVIAILIGSMWNSPAGHVLANKWFSEDKVSGGYMTIYEGQAGDVIEDSNGRPVAKLPFGIALTEFAIEYYPAKDDQWILVAVVPRAGTSPHEMEGQPAVDQHVLNWKTGEELVVPTTHVKLKVIEYIPHARAIVDPANGPESPAVGAKADPANDRPAMKLELIGAGGVTKEAWLIVPEGQDAAMLSLQARLGSAAGDLDPGTLGLAAPRRADVIADHAPAGGHEVLGERAAHDAEADQADRALVPLNRNHSEFSRYRKRIV
jgi:hypothetical protein